MSTTTSSYWLNRKFLILGSGLLVVVGISALIIWKYEGSPKSGKQEKDSKKKKVGFLYKDEAWTTCHKSIHPAWLLAYRLIAFTFLLSILSSDAFLNSTEIFFFYTQWTFSLVTIYFGLGSALSIYGCFRYRKASAKVCCIHEERNDSPTLEKNSSLPGVSKDLSSLEKNSSLPGVSKDLSSLEKNSSLPGVSKDLSSDEETDDREPAGYLGYAFQIIFQVCAGAVVLTDCIYWLLIYPFFLPSGFGLKFLVVGMHSINAVTLFGDVILNSLRFPFFRFAYFVLYTCTFVAFQWLVHMCVDMWWPYPFLDLENKYATYLYLMAGVIHLPSYGMFALVIALKYWLARLFKWMMRKLSGNKQ